MRIAMIGTGYVGLVSGACLSEFGHDVVCIDKDAEKIAALKRGDIPIYEPGLDEVVAANVKAGPPVASPPIMASAVRGADAVFIAVGTPSRARRRPCRSHLCLRRGRGDRAARSTGYTVVVTKSTVPVGTGRKVERHHPPSRGPTRSSTSPPIRNSCARARRSRISAARTASSSAATRERAREVMREIYRPLYLHETPIVFTSRESAELIKYAANAFLATKITFINEMADLCEKVGADVQDVARGIGLDGRIGNKFLHAGPGLRRLVLSQGHAGAAARPREDAARRRASSRRWSAVNDGAQDRDGARRSRAPSAA